MDRARSARRGITRGTATALLLLCLCACSPLVVLNGLVPGADFTRTAGLAYGTHERQRLDVYVPRPRAEGSAALPVVVFFYGGGWQGGNRNEYLFAAEALASRGFVVVVPDYRVYPEVRYPDFVEDGARAVSWTADNIGRFAGDPRRIALMGHSAGAHIAAMLAYNPRFLDPATRARLSGFVGLAGPYDFTPTDPLIHAILSGEGDVALSMPARFVTGREPPSLLVTGGADNRVSPENTERLARKLRDSGSRVEVLRYPSMGHAGLLWRLAAPFRKDEMLDVIERFIRQ